MSNGDRPTIKKITVEMEYPPGSGTIITRTFPENEGDELPAALFFSDHGIEILGAFYENLPKTHEMSYDKVKDKFKEARAKKLGNPGDIIKIKAKDITTLWNTEDTAAAPGESKLLALVAKDPGCDSSG